MRSIVIHTVALLTLLCFPSCVIAEKIHADEVTSPLPGMEGLTIPFKHFAGYLPSTGSRQIFYWFLESQSNPAKDPVVLWLNGGPGCSGFGGSITGHSYFKFNPSTSTISANPYSWNTIANVIYIDSPCAVGYSYSTNKTEMSSGWSDTTTSAATYEFLLNFFKEYSEFKSNEFAVIGESYAGIYVPTLAQVIDKQNNLLSSSTSSSKINLVKFGIGNGAIYNNKITSLFLQWKYYDDHDMISPDLFPNVINTCCNGKFDTACITATANSDQFGQECVDVINSLVIAGTAVGSGEGGATVLNSYNYIDRCLKSGPSDPPCYNFVSLINFANLDSVKKALHVSPLAQTYAFCNSVVNRNYLKDQKNVVSILKNLSSKYPLLLYYADLDSQVPYTTADSAILEMNLPKTQSKKVIVEHSAMPDGVKQILGWQDVYSSGSNGGYVSYIVVRGSGHVVPTDKPYDMLQILTDFMNITMPADIVPYKLATDAILSSVSGDNHGAVYNNKDDVKLELKTINENFRKEKEAKKLIKKNLHAMKNTLPKA